MLIKWGSARTPMASTLHNTFTPSPETAADSIMAVAASWTLTGFSGIPQQHRQVPWRLVADAEVTEKWGILSAQTEHRFLNTLQVPYLAAQCLQQLESGQWQVRFTTLGSGHEFILFQSGSSLTGNAAPELLSAAGVGKAAHRHLFEEAMPLSPEQATALHARFKSAWADGSKLRESSKLKEQLQFLASPHPAQWVYMKACQIFVPDTEVKDDYLDDPPGYTSTAIWQALFDFQRDGVKGVINKILKYNGCILADSVGLGKTYEALAVIKYFARRGDKVLVLAPKRLRDNWALFTANDDRNPFVEDPFHYTLLNHTDIGRNSGKSGDVDLAHFRWEHFDFIVIDESHNFRNKGSRYEQLLQQVIRRGAKTKILLLTATPVNNRVTDLRNQINLIAGGNDAHLQAHGIGNITETARQAQKKFAAWAKTPEQERVGASLLQVLGQDYIHLLDLLTIARSRKHIKEHYRTSSGVNMFPQRLTPINCYPQAGDDGFLPVAEISLSLQKLKMAVYRPLHYVLPHRKDFYLKKYNQQIRTNVEFSQEDREKSLSALMTVNLLKRMESSVEAYAITLKKQIDATEALLGKLSSAQELELTDGIPDDEQDEDTDWLGSAKVKIALHDVDRIKWAAELTDDLTLLQQLQGHIDTVRKTQDSKLRQLRELIEQKVLHPINAGNRKVIIFTAFADTAEYLYAKLTPRLQQEFGLHSAMVSGSRSNRCTLPGLRLDQDTLLSAFSPRSKKFDLTRTQGKQVDILIATDCVSEGQNLQDCDYLINADIHWNPVRIIQRFGRIDRIGSTNTCIQMVNMWPVAELNDYINLEQRVKDKMNLLDANATGHDNLLSEKERQEFEFRAKQLLQLKDTAIDLEDVKADATITALNFQQQRTDLQNFRSEPSQNRPELWPSYLGAAAAASATVRAGAFFLLKSHADIKADKSYPYAPYYLLHVADDGTVTPQFRDIKEMLTLLQVATYGRHKVVEAEQVAYDKRTRRGEDMAHYTKLLSAAVRELMGEEKVTIARSVFSGGKSMVGRGRTARGVDDVEVIAWLAILP